MTLGLGIITRNSELDILKNCVASCLNGVDSVYITVADKEEPSKEMADFVQSIGGHLSYFKWCNDFAAARNFNMSQCKDDWYVWADTDDEVVGMDSAKKFLASIPSHTKFVLCTYNYSFMNGKPDVKHVKERFIKNDGSHVWKGKVHETCVSEFQTGGVKCDSIVWNHRTTEERSVESYKRNMDIAEKEVSEQIAKDGKPDPRSLFNLGMAYCGLAQRTGKQEDWERALSVFAGFVEIGEWDEHLFSAWKFMGICYSQINRLDLALNAYFQCLRLKPQYSDAHAALARTYDGLGDDEKAEAWYRTALLATEENAYSDEVTTRKVSCLVGIGMIAIRKNKFEDAIKIFEQAKEMSGDDVMVNNVLKEAYRIKEDLETSRQIIKQLEALHDDKKQAAYDALDPKWKGYPEVCAWRHKHAFKKESTGKDLAIFTGISWEEWNPDSAKSGIGGSEEAVINMAEQLAILGWNVTVYGTHGIEPKKFGDVWYKPYWDFSSTEPVDIFVAWRDPAIFDYEINAKKKFLWLHDTIPEGAIMVGGRIDKIDKIMVLSDYHRSLYPHIADSKIMKTGNGINPDHFNTGDIVKDPAKILYTSAPNRGLECLLDMWPTIKAKVPNATLYWAYGWETFDKMQSNNPKAMAWKREMEIKLQQPGVIALGRIGHEELAKLMLSAGVWAYPTEFTEVYCITAVKMQAAGCWPVCTNVAALDEMVKFGTKFNEEHIYTDKAVQADFIDAVEKYAKYDLADRSEMMEWARTEKSWLATAKQWDKEFHVYG